MDAQDAVDEALFRPKCNMQLIKYRFRIRWVLRKSVRAVMLRQSMVDAKAVNNCDYYGFLGACLWMLNKASCSRILWSVAERYRMLQDAQAML